MKEKFNYSSSAGKQISVREWKDEDRKEYKGIVQIVHGMQESIERYEEFADWLTKEGYIVVGHDQLGHGETAKTKEEVGFFAEKDGWMYLVEDVHLLYELEKEKYPNLPYIIYAHSMGSMVIRTYLIQYQDSLQGVILSGTSGQKRKLTLGISLIKMMKIFLRKKIP